ncbi:MAG: GWxTD domain-containing protein [Bacteroidetes bacterium]|nr:GWxTD domain-containing protein [Bacteroidota bacterium]
MKKIILFILYVTCLTSAQNTLLFDFDFARFSYDSSSSYLEIYYSFDINSLTKVTEDNKEKTSAILQIVLQNEVTQEYIVNREWELDAYINKNGVKTEDQVGNLGILVPVGKYLLRVTGKDKNNIENEKFAESILEIKPLLSDAYKLSDIQLASKIINDNANTNSIFYKNTLEVFPNPTRMYTNSSPVLFYYSELYNLLTNKGVYRLDKLVVNNSGKNYHRESKIINGKNNSLVEAGLINLSKFPNDTYNLVFSLIDTTTNSAVMSSKKFIYFDPDNPNKSISSEDATLASNFDELTEEECENIFSVSKYLMKDDERDEYDDLEKIELKREFLSKFWTARDDSPESLRNENYDIYMNRVQFANTHFTNALKDGYKTDMGRVYLMFGPPDDREMVPMSGDKHPHEIWTYMQIEQGVRFVFADLSGFGNYTQIYSNKRGEVSDSDWEERLMQSVDLRGN